jgi:hypothetical protein
MSMSRNHVYLIGAIIVLFTGVVGLTVFGLQFHVPVRNTGQVLMESENDEAEAVTAIEQMGGHVDYEANESGKSVVGVHLSSAALAAEARKQVRLDWAHCMRGVGRLCLCAQGFVVAEVCHPLL